MPDPDSRRLDRLRPALETRARILHYLRRFFLDRDFLEIDTPVRVAVPAMEQHIDAIPADGAHLRTSPELHMKRLLAAGYEKIFQMGPCFRRGEFGHRHHPEYCMLEWYRAHGDYRDVLHDTTALLAGLCHELEISRPALAAPPEIIEVSDAFLRHAGWNPCEAYDEARFELDLVDRVEPNLPRDRPVILIHYPRECGALARCKPAPPHLAERWELYLDGVEIANAYSELTDAGEQRRRFAEWGRWRGDHGKAVYPLDEDFLRALARMPPSGGIALGVDRLVMVCLDAESLDDVIAFRECGTTPRTRGTESGPAAAG
jgi:lysyl-tRNA synthetase class 2